MTAHAGQSILNFSLRIVGTFIAMCASLTIWYMCDQKPAAIIPIRKFFPRYAVNDKQSALRRGFFVGAGTHHCYVNLWD